MRTAFVRFSIIALLLVFGLSFLWKSALWSLILLIPVIAMGVYDMIQTHHAIKRNYPILGRMRYVMEDLRPKIYQYFVESDIDGRPINRIERSTIYQRAKLETDTTPFGTQLDVYAEGYEWMAHSIKPMDAHKMDMSPRVTIGGATCTQPYRASVLNVSAMSFGSLSPNAIEALNGGAQIGGFAHNTGEGGISPYHLAQEGDLVWQIGTGYFGARDKEGAFNDEAFATNASLPMVKMIEIKLSQGAKPGHGGILPAKKNTPEIAKIRLVEPYTTVYSPPFHSAFTTPRELVQFIARLRKLSNGKPIGFKLCVGKKSDFIGICKAMIAENIFPDFITVDGGEGGTGAAPPEFSNFVGMPFMEGLSFVHDTLVGFGIREHIKVIGSGKILSGFHIVRAMALGADACNSARAMMMAVGCIQALLCNTNACPTGVATQDPELTAGLVVEDKKQRVANFHKNTVTSFVELMCAAGISDPSNINRHDIYRRVFMNQVRSFEDIYPTPEKGILLSQNIPDTWRTDMKMANVDGW
jgi:glutamate synthase domain-containing protein 2